MIRLNEAQINKAVRVAAISGVGGNDETFMEYMRDNHNASRTEANQFYELYADQIYELERNVAEWQNEGTSIPRFVAYEKGAAE